MHIERGNYERCRACERGRVRGSHEPLTQSQAEEQESLVGLYAQTWSVSRGGSSRAPTAAAHPSGGAEEEEVEEEVEVEEEEEEEETGGVPPILDKDGESTGERGAGEAVKERRSGREIERNGTEVQGRERAGMPGQARGSKCRVQGGEKHIPCSGKKIKNIYIKKEINDFEKCNY